MRHMLHEMPDESIVFTFLSVLWTLPWMRPECAPYREDMTPLEAVRGSSGGRHCAMLLTHLLPINNDLAYQQERAMTNMHIEEDVSASVEGVHYASITSDQPTPMPWPCSWPGMCLYRRL